MKLFLAIALIVVAYVAFSPYMFVKSLETAREMSGRGYPSASVNAVAASSTLFAPGVIVWAMVCP